MRKKAAVKVWDWAAIVGQMPVGVDGVSAQGGRSCS